jgi:methylated-DNA-[protein]-cysteine S-methyltransferase
MSFTVDTPVGSLGFDATDGAITRMHWGGVGNLGPSPLADLIKNEVEKYFAKELTNFTIPVAPKGTDFQQTFYAALSAIPYGETRTYGDLADELNVSAQAIGQACGANPIAIIIPCHRVLGANSLGGFSGFGGVESKVDLLKLEGAGSLLI